jgi:hypothetical protein
MFYDDPYLEFVHQQALKDGKYFILDSGEGRDLADPVTGWYVEDLSGWLIDPKDHQRFIAARQTGTVDDDFAKSYVFAKWSKDTEGNLHITFKHY